MRSVPVLDTDTPEFEPPVEATQAPVGTARRVGAFLLRELRENVAADDLLFHRL